MCCIDQETVQGNYITNRILVEFIGLPFIRPASIVSFYLSKSLLTLHFGWMSTIDKRANVEPFDE